MQEVITETCQGMLTPPARLLGMSGIMKFSKEILRWEKFSPNKLKKTGMVNYFQINEAGGTGGGLFRRMYGGFLLEASNILQNDKFAHAGRQFIRVSEQWDDLADDLWQLSLEGDTALLKKMSDLIQHIYSVENNLYLSLMEAAGKIEDSL